MKQEGNVIQKFREVVENRHQYAENWKATTGGKVIGCMCSYVPVEIIYAAGMLPVRILGSHQLDRLSDAYLYGWVCPFWRDCLSQGLRGRYNYLDGIVYSHTCDATHSIFLIWRKYVPINFSHFIYMPGIIQSPRALPLLTAEFADFKEVLEKQGNRLISEEELSTAVQEYNINRGLMKQVYEFRKKDEPPLTGKEALEIALASQLMDVREHNELLRQLLSELPNQKLDRETGVRLMLVGSVNDDLTFMELMEGVGATCVIEENCASTKHFWDEVVAQGSQLEAIASRYINRWPCPVFDWKETGEERGRWKRLWPLAQEYRVQGVVHLLQRFCGPNGYDLPYIRDMFGSRDIPVLTLEFDVTIPVGQFRTRIEAFLEMLTLELI